MDELHKKGDAWMEKFSIDLNEIFMGWVKGQKRWMELCRLPMIRQFPVCNVRLIEMQRMQRQFNSIRKLKWIMDTSGGNENLNSHRRRENWIVSDVVN